MIEKQESTTAKLCSFARAFHSNYEKQKVFDDYLAFDLMGKEEYDEIGQLIEHEYDAEAFDAGRTFSSAGIRPQLNTYISPIPLSRIAYAERELEMFSMQRGRCQYVICGAGMDTFAFRNANPDILIFEIDHPDTQRYKLEKIRRLEWNMRENVKYVSVDFSKDDMAENLKAAGFDPRLPSFFSILGVTYYLTLPVFENTLERISSISSTGSKLVFDFPDETTLSPHAARRVTRLAEITAGLGEPMLHGYTVDEVNDALERQGYIIDDHATPKKIQKRFFDGKDTGQSAFENIHFILAKKGDKFNESYYLYI